MQTVEMLEHALALVSGLGYEIRQDCMAGAGGGCELRGKKLFFLDLDLGPQEQLEKVLDLLRREPKAAQMDMPRELRALIVPG